MDTQSDSSGALDTNQAATLFADIFEPPTKEDKPEPPEVEAKPEAEPEDAQATPDDEAESTEEDDPVVTVRVDGKDIEVKLSELKNGYQKDRSANQRFEQAAELRKTADADMQKAQAERQAYAQNLQRFQAKLEGDLQEQQKIDWDTLLNTDPVEYLKQQRLATERQATLQKAYAESQKVQALSQADQAKAHQDYLNAQAQELLDKLPEWKDESKAKADKSALREYLLDQGYDAQSVNNVADARAVVLARKAMLYDQMISKAQVAAKKVSALPQKVERSGTGDGQGLDKRASVFQRFDKSRTMDDAAAVFASLL